MKTIKLIISLALILLVLCAANISAQTTAFTYQGKLTDGSVPANGTYPTRFALFDTATGGSAIASQTPNVTVINGIFTVTLDFGANAFDGNARYLEISIDENTLTPRQPITSAPYAIRSSKAAVADNALLLNGMAASDFVLTTDSRLTDARAASSVDFRNVTLVGALPIANGGTGSQTQNFVDLTTNQTIAGRKTFTDPLFGNGSGLTNVVGTMRWQVVSGTSQQAQSNNGYIATDAGQITITLPTAPNIGDVVRVSGIGPGGWKIAQNAGQSVLGANLGFIGVTWTARDSNRNWYSVASSADGSKLVAVVQGGLIYTSTDSGVAWTPRDSNRFWQSVASSADGSKLVAGVAYDGGTFGQIYTSTDSGETWTARGAGSKNWKSVASSADGSKLVAVAMTIGFNFGQIFTSTNSGVTWTPRVSGEWISVASSADGSKLVAANYGGIIYTSIDSGVTWTARDPLVNRNWNSVASSADGSKLVATVYGGQIYISTDSGVVWTARQSVRSWSSVASSADGSKLVAVVQSGQIYTSTDSGVTSTPRESNRQWSSVASSDDGSKLAAVVSGGTIYVSSPNTTTGTAGYLLGGQGTAIELQYIGSGQFLPISHEGTITGF